MVTRNFAPWGQVGVERVIKYAKYLPEFGWEPIVLTGSSGAYGFKKDLALAKDVEDVVALRCFVPDLFRMVGSAKGLFRHEEESAGGYVTRGYTPTSPWHPKSLVIPDSQVLWTIPAVYTALRNARKFNWDIVYTTLSPPTNALAAYLIAKSLRLPLLLDYRDPWTDAFFSPRRLKPLAALEARLEARIFSYASAVTALDPVCLRTPLSNVQDPPPTEIIPNGYDEDDFDCELMDLPKWSIVHTGNLHASRPLTDLWSILEIALQRQPVLRNQVHFWQLGTVDEFVISQLENPPEGLITHYVPPVPMKQSIQYMLGADLLVVIPYHKDKNTPAKIYQYLRANRPTLVLCEEEADELVATAADANDSFSCYFKEHERAAEYVTQQFQAPRKPTPPIGPKITKYSRREQTGRLARMLATAMRGSL